MDKLQAVPWSKWQYSQMHKHQRVITIGHDKSTFK